MMTLQSLAASFIAFVAIIFWFSLDMTKRRDILGHFIAAFSTSRLCSGTTYGATATVLPPFLSAQSFVGTRLHTHYFQPLCSHTLDLHNNLLLSSTISHPFLPFYYLFYYFFSIYSFQFILFSFKPTQLFSIAYIHTLQKLATI